MSQVKGNAMAIFEGIKQRRTLTGQEAEIWATFVAALFGRTRKVKAQILERPAKCVPVAMRQTSMEGA